MRRTTIKRIKNSLKLYGAKYQGRYTVFNTRVVAKIDDKYYHVCFSADRKYFKVIPEAPRLVQNSRRLVEI